MKNDLTFARRTCTALALGTFVLTSSPAFAQDFVARMGHLESPEQSRHLYLEKVAEMVTERTNGAVEIQLFPQGQLGNQRVMTESVQLGTLEATAAPAAFLGGFNPLVSILDIPYLMPTDPAEAQALREGPFGDALLDSFSDRGVVGIAWWPNGMKNFTSNSPLDNITAFADQKFRVMDSRILIEQFNALGASAISLPFSELYTSLQTGVVDGQENPLDTIQKMKFFEVQDYLVISEHGAMEDVILFNPTWWNSLPEEYQEIINAAFDEVVPELITHKAESIKQALDIISQSDINIRIAPTEERTAFRDAMYDKSVAAYIDSVGNEGAAALIEIYNANSANP